MGKKTKGIITTIVIVLFVCAFLFAVAKIAKINSLEDIWKYSKKKSQEIAQCVDPKKGGCDPGDIGKAIDKGIANAQKAIAGGNSAPAPSNDKKEDKKETQSSTPNQNDPKKPAPAKKDSGKPFYLPSALVSKDVALNQLNSIQTKNPDSMKYSRAEWKHWSRVPGRSACWNTRQEALYKQAEPGSVKLINKSKQEVKDVNQACAVVSGKWIDPYSGEVFINPKDLDVDHVVALGFTARHGGQAWDKKQKEIYANDLQDVLLVTSARENRSKSDKGPSEYMPPLKDYQCGFAKNYIGISHKYKLSMTAKDKEVLTQALQTCKE